MSDLSQTITAPSDTHCPAPPVLWQLELSHYNEKVRWALDYKRVPHERRSLLPGPHRATAERLTADTSTTPVLTLDGRSIGDSSRIIAAIEQRWPQPSLYPDNDGQRQRALELEEFFDEKLGPHFRRAFYDALLPRTRSCCSPCSAMASRPSSEPLCTPDSPRCARPCAGACRSTPPGPRPVAQKVIAAMDRLEREISAGGYLVGDSFTVADLTAAALFYGVARPPEFPYPMCADDRLPGAWREFLDSLAQRPGGQWVADIYHRHRGESAELRRDAMPVAPTGIS